MWSLILTFSGTIFRRGGRDWKSWLQGTKSWSCWFYSTHVFCQNEVYTTSL